MCIFKNAAEENKEILGSKPDKKYTIIDMFRLSELRKRSIIMAWVWWVSMNLKSLCGLKMDLVGVAIHGPLICSTRFSTA